MRIIATAFPNPAYENIHSLRDMFIEACLMDDGIKIVYIEKHTKSPAWIAEVKEETVRDLFYTIDRSEKERPFLKENNQHFYAVLNRERKKYNKIFRTLKFKALT
jgi:hypothetical protein